MISRFLFLIMLSSFFLSGCATNRSIIDVTVPRSIGYIESNGKEVFINLPVDQRKFEKNPIADNVPSLNPRRTQTGSVKARAISRKSNGFEERIGDVLLPRKKSVALLTQRALRQAFFEKGFKVIDDQNSINEKTYIVDANIFTFWSWSNMEFWRSNVKLSTEISTNLTITAPEGTKCKIVSVKMIDRVSAGFDSNLRNAMNDAVKLYIDSVKKEI